MKSILLKILSALQLVFLWSIVNGQPTDPFCHMEVLSGSPVLFSFSTADDYSQGKVLHYTTTVRAYYMKAPKYWEFCVRSSDGLFDGPGNLSTNIVGVKLEDLYFQNMNTKVTPGSNQYYNWDIMENVRLSTGGSTLATCYVNTQTYGAPYSLFFVVRFQIIINDDVQIDDRTAGYYASQALFYMRTTYY